MLLCSSCPSRFIVGSVCSGCSKLFCHDHRFTSCPFCSSPLEEISVENEEFDGITAQWLNFKDSRGVGVVRLDRLPSYTMNIVRKIPHIKGEWKIVLFPSKVDSMEFEGVIREKHGQTRPTRPLSERSRYTVLSFERTDPVYLLLNVSAIKESALIFLLDLSSKFSERFADNRLLLESHYRELVDVFVQTFFSYDKKMGIPFVYANEVILELVRNMIQNLQQNYIESITIREMLKESRFNALADYIAYKIGLSLETFDHEMRFQLIEVYQVIDKMFHIAILLSSISDHTPLFQYTTNTFRKDFETFKANYFELPDLLRAVDLLFSKKDKIDFSSYERFVKTTKELFSEAFREIEARYVSLGETIALMKISEFYLEGLQNGLYPYDQNIGFVDNYIELLEGVFDKEGIYPEVRIMAGMALLNILFTWTTLDRDYSRFLTLVERTKLFSSLLVKSLPEIQRKNGTMTGFVGSPLAYEDAAINLLSTSKMARSFEDLERENELLKLAEQMANKYDLPSTKIHLWWGEFVSSQDYSYLHKIHEIIDRVDFDKFPYLQNTLLSIDLLIQAIIYREDIESRLDKAQDLILNDITKTTGQEVHIVQSIQHSEALFHVFAMFRHLLKSSKAPENLRKAYVASIALEKTLAKTDPLNLLIEKTRLLYELTTDNLVEASKLSKKLINYPDPNGKISQYLQYAQKWIKICNKQNERRYIYQKDFHYAEDDIWTQILQSHIQKTMERDLLRNVSGSTAIVFVEGDTDELVLKKFASKLYPKNKISFLDIEGHTNYGVHVEAKMTRELKIPTYLIFDGDTREKRKKDIEKQFDKLSISRKNIYTLSKNSVEDYLLCPKAIKKAYPKIRLGENHIKKFFHNAGAKKNKKAVLKTLFKHGDIGKYDKRVACAIAHNFEIAEIDDELKHLILKIESLGTLD